MNANPSSKPTLTVVLVCAVLAGCSAKADPQPPPAPSGSSQTAPPADAGVADRAFNVQVLTKIAEPVLDALSKNQLKQLLPVRDWEKERAHFSRFEAFARTLCGVAPWIELGPDATPEGQQRAHFIELARQALINATDPSAPDHLNFSDSEGDQPLVEHAYLASALLAAPNQLWEPLTGAQKANVLDALRTGARIKNNHNNNWILFPAMIQAALWKYSGDADTKVIEDAVNTFTNEWYVGDGAYSDGPFFHFDYYNSFVIHPFLLQVLGVAQEKHHPLADSLKQVMPRALRYATVLERLISPEGTFPVIGRSEAYRFGILYHLSYMALRRDLPAEVDQGAVRSAQTAVVRRIFEAPGTFDDQGWLQLGVVGSQPAVQEVYNSTGSLYITLIGLVDLGLPASDQFWTAPAASWTQKRIWAGENVPKDEKLED